MKNVWIQQLPLIELAARCSDNDKKLKSLEYDPKGTYKVINRLLDKEYGTDNLTNGLNNQKIADNLKDFFDSEVKKINSGIEDDVSVSMNKLSGNTIGSYTNAK